MAQLRRFGPSDLLLLLLVLAVAAGVRVGYLVRYADNAQTDGPLRVQEVRTPLAHLESGNDAKGDEVEILSKRVREDMRFVGPAPFSGAEEETTAHASPGYPHLVGLLASQLPEGMQLESTVRGIQAGLGSLTAAFYFLFARRAFRSLLVGTLAGLFAALHPFWVISVAAIADGTLASFVLAACLLFAGRAGERGGWISSALLGLSLGGLALVRAALLPFSFVALIWFLLRSRSLRRGWLCGLLAFAGFVGSLAPWTARNFEVYNEPLPVVSTAYLHLWVGNNPEATGGPATPEMFDTVPEELAKEMRGTANQPARYARLGREVLSTVQEEPIETIRRRFYAAAAFVFGAAWLGEGRLAETLPVVDQADDDTPPDQLIIGHGPLLHAVMLALVVLSFLGWRWSYGWRWESMPATLAVLWVPLPYILGHAEYLSGPRLPLDGVLLCYCAFTLGCLVPVWGSRLLQAPDAGESVHAQ